MARQVEEAPDIQAERSRMSTCCAYKEGGGQPAHVRQATDRTQEHNTPMAMLNKARQAFCLSKEATHNDGQLCEEARTLHTHTRARAHTHTRARAQLALRGRKQADSVGPATALCESGAPPAYR